MRKINGNTTVSWCLDGSSILQDTVKNFDLNYKDELDTSEHQTHSVANDPMLRGTNFSLSLKNLDVTLDRLNPNTGFDSVHTTHIKNSKRCYRIFLCKFCKKLFSHTYNPHSLRTGHIRPTVKKISGNKTDSKKYRPVMNSSNFLKVLEYLLFPHLEKQLPVHENQIAYRPATVV